MPILKGGFTLCSKYNTRSSISINRRVFSDALTVRGWKSTQWRGKSYAVSEPYEVPETPKGPRKVSRDERRAMVESFVNKYRATNGGKFPTSSLAKKEVGGGFYFIRKVIQELEYNSKNFVSERDGSTLLQKDIVNQEDKSFKEDEIISKEVSRPLLDPQTTANNNVENNDASDKLPEPDEQLQTSIEALKTSEGVVDLSPSVSSVLPYVFETQSNRLNEDCGNPDLPEIESKLKSDTLPENPAVDKEQSMYEEYLGSVDRKLKGETDGVSDSVLKDTEKTEQSGNVKKLQAAPEAFLNSNDSKNKAADQGSPDSGSFAKDSSEKRIHNAEFPKKSSSEASERQIDGVELPKISSSEIEKQIDSVELPNTSSSEIEQQIDDLQLGKKSFREASKRLIDDEELPNKSSNYPSERQTGDEELPKKSSLWGNLKSFADGIINFWRKQ